MGGGLPGISVQWVDCQGVCQEQGQEECMRLVAQYQVVVGRVVTEGGEVGTSLVNERIYSS
jgi:hypothetical protein